ncbi:LOW QUALITY PROTEIN: uncharacterized protein EMH_0016180 [Eimeria mitis]|uniref:Rhodanese domain-containing protein n=1 Tax=Eimeria mitis TaxID=44415 RepID=U6K682_9EIME|nr:LOW QUALITY PROTEIN: uncharacterized protein EMH_0016180 [Eimeria mitis]CDJ33459.1 hypothetical protein, conserved [Eimeria mitis]
MPRPPLGLLLLVLLLLYDEPTRAWGYIRHSRASLLIPRTNAHERPNRQLRANSSSSSRCSDTSSSNSTSGGPSDSECPRCVWLRTSEDASPVVVGGEWGLGEYAFKNEYVHQRLSSKLGGGAAAAASAVDPRTAAAQTVVDIVPVEVGIAPETRRALGLLRGSHKRHIFLPLWLLGPFQDLTGGDALPEAATQAGGFWEGQGAVCKVLKLGEDFCGGVPLQLVAQVSAPETKSRTTLQSESPMPSHGAKQVASHDGLQSEEGPIPELLPLASEEEALRVLREHYGPLLAQYRRLPHCSTCIPPSSMASGSTKRENGFKGSTALRILRLPRGPRLSLQLQLEPSLPSVPFSTGDASLHDFPIPPPLGAAETHNLTERSTSAVPPPYQLVSLYKFFSVRSPKALAELLRALWGPKGVLGRAYVAKEGLNAQLAVPSVAMSDILGELQQIPGLEDGVQVTPDCLVAFEEYWRSPPFDALHIRPRHQVLRDGFAAPLDWVDCGEEVDPSVWHRKLMDMLQQQHGQQQHARKIVLLDMRNANEYAVGHFKGARCINTPTFADSFAPGGPLEEALLQAGVQLPSRNATPHVSSGSGSGEDVEVMMYCTGGIRCVKAGAFLKQVLGFPRVTRLKGGILAYKNYILKLRGACCKDAGCTSFAPEEKTLSAGVFGSRKDEAGICDTARRRRYLLAYLVQEKMKQAYATPPSQMDRHRQLQMELITKQKKSRERIPPRACFWGATIDETSAQDLWNWAHQVATAASSPSALQEALLEEGRSTAKSLVGAAKGVPQFWSGHLHARILSAISRLKRPSSILEIGAFVGISKGPTSSSSRSPPYQLISVESLNQGGGGGCFAVAGLISSSPWSPLIRVVEADALQWLRSQRTAARSISSGQAASEGTRLGNVALQGGMLPDGGFDLIYLDAEKKKYAEYIACILDPDRPLLAPKGALLIDNTLWGRGHDGKRPSWEDEAAEDAPRTRRYSSIAESMKALREALRNDPRISHGWNADSSPLCVQVLLPVGDGLSIVTWATPASNVLP